MAPTRQQPKFSGRDAYGVLGVRRTATDEELKHAYKSLALKEHPDKASPEAREEATRRFQELQAAYEAVSPANRRAYDSGPAGLELGKTELMAACQVGDIQTVRMLLTQSVDVNARDSTGRTAILYAAGAGRIELLEMLVERGANVEDRNCAGHSAVMFAVGAGLKIDDVEGAKRAYDHWEAARFLLDQGAPVNAATSYGLTALMLASAAGRLNMVELLLQRGADANARSDIGLTAVAMAADKGHAQVIQNLLVHAADPNALHGAGRTPLMGAAAQAHTEAVSALLDGGAKVNAQADDGHTALLFAVTKGLKDGLVCPVQGAEVEKPSAEAVTSLLLEAAADPRMAGPGGRTALHAACAGNCRGIAALLLARGVRPSRAVDAEGRTPIQVAESAGHWELAELVRGLDAGRGGVSIGWPVAAALPSLTLGYGCCWEPFIQIVMGKR